MADVRPFTDVVEHAHEDMTVTVQAGMTIAELQSVLAPRRQHLPIDVPAPRRSTIGGMIAANLCGSRRFSRGTVRDLLIGLRVIGSGGRLIQAGGRVVKNVAGYDLCKLYTGSWGWLGIIVEATFRVCAIPERAAAVAIRCESPASAEAACAAVLSSSVQPATLDLLNGRVAAECDLPEAPLVLVIGLEGLSETVDAQVAKCGELFGESSAARSDQQYAGIRAAVSDLALADGLGVRLSLSSDRVADFVSTVTAKNPKVRIAAHIGNGVINVLFEATNAAGLRGMLRDIENLGGHWLMPREIDAARCELPMFGPPRDDWAVMRRVKQAFDPANIFNRGAAFDRTMTAANPIQEPSPPERVR